MINSQFSNEVACRNVEITTKDDYGYKSTDQNNKNKNWINNIKDGLLSLKHKFLC